jgi:hypothetical protein
VHHARRQRRVRRAAGRRASRKQRRGSLRVHSHVWQGQPRPGRGAACARQQARRSGRGRAFASQLSPKARAQRVRRARSRKPRTRTAALANVRLLRCLARNRKEVDYTAEREQEAEEAGAGGAAGAPAAREPYTPRVPTRLAAPSPPDPEARKRNAKGELIFDDAPVRRTARLLPQPLRARAFESSRNALVCCAFLFVVVRAANRTSGRG